MTFRYQDLFIKLIFSSLAGSSCNGSFDGIIRDVGEQLESSLNETNEAAMYILIEVTVDPNIDDPAFLVLFQLSYSTSRECDPGSWS